MKVYIELASLEEAREALEALTVYKEIQGEVFTEEKAEPKEPKEEPKEPKEPEPEAQEEPVAVPTLTEVREAVKTLKEAVGLDRTKELLGGFGAKGASSVPEESRAEFLEKAEELING